MKMKSEKSEKSKTGKVKSHSPSSKKVTSKPKSDRPKSVPASAASASRKEVATASASVASSAGSAHGARNITLITTGYRTRVRDEGRPYAAFAEGWLPKSQQALHEEWDKRIGKIKEADWVIGSGEYGIFSKQFGEQCLQLADADNTYAISTGLGLVNLSGMYPQYDLGAMEADIRNFPGLDKKLISDKTWWMFVCGLGGHSIFDTVMSAIDRGHRVIIAATGLNFFSLKLDTVRLAELPQDRLAVVRQHLRIVGPELDPVIHPKLLPCVMPYDRPGLDRCVPGSRANGVRRAAYLLQHVSPTPKDGRSSPREDAERMSAAFRDEGFTPLEYRAPTQASSDSPKHAQISDEEVTRLVRDTYIDLTGRDAYRIARIMREDGYWVRQEKIEEVLATLEHDGGGHKTGGSGGGSKTSKASAAASAKAGKKKPSPPKKSAAQAHPVNGNGVHHEDKPAHETIAASASSKFDDDSELDDVEDSDSDSDSDVNDTDEARA